jgi:RNA polymerase sigma-70 factor (ECF subfamily)
MRELIGRHGEMLARLVGRLTAWSADHEDVFQELLLKIWQKAGSYRGAGSLEGWLRRMAVNLCHNHLRRQNSIRQMLTRFVDFQRNDQQVESSAEPSSRLQKALRKLNGNDRTVLVLYYLEEMSGEEVADALGIKTESVHVRLHRARQKLKSILSTKGDA